MQLLKYVFPNISTLNRNGIRGNYQERWCLAKKYGCSYVEIPAHLIKNKSELQLTGQYEGTIAFEESIYKMYGDENIPREMRYILHTEPAIGSGKLYWYDNAWTGLYIDMILGISLQIGRAPSYVEVHPGNNKNSITNILSFVDALCTQYTDNGISVPTILLENRTGHKISCGEDMRELWTTLETDYPHLAESFGFVVDFRTMYTQITKMYVADYAARLLESIESIPPKSILGAHIHNTHFYVPTLQDEVPWEQIMQLLGSLNHDIIVNPEVNKEILAKNTLQFVRGFF